MFSVTALRRPIRITNLHMASGSWRRELYRVSFFFIITLEPRVE